LNREVEQQVDVDRKTLDELIALMRRDGLDRLRVEVGEVTLDLRMTELSANARPAVEVKRNASLDAPRQQSASPDIAPPGVTKVLAPLVGVFYRAPAPGAKPFVEVGDEVTAGHVLCILEAMKLMNEIVSEHNGRVVRICAQDGQLVSLHQELFWIET
jgi:acetyl-CoA carboxylase biotin carboxyl carrier protein